MNPKQLKRLRKKAREIFLQFIKESLSLEKQANVTDEKINFLINNLCQMKIMCSMRLKNSKKGLRN